MKLTSLRTFAVLGAALALATCARTSRAQILSTYNSDVEGFFGSQSDAFQQSELPISPTWPASGPGFYPVTGVPNVPPLYATFPNPVFPVTTNIPFDAPLGHTLGTPFTDGTTSASYNIYGGFNGPGTGTGDAYVDLGPLGAAGMYLNQPASATGYAYEQANFAIDYSVGALGLAASNVAVRPYVVAGNVIPGGYAQFGADLTYWWLTNIPGTTIITSTTNLGSLQYNYQVPISGGPFSAVVNPNPFALAGATGSGILEITGSVFVAGDPFSITVNSLPEPSGVVLAALGLIGLAAYVRRKRANR
jgi:hypothetical protein